MAGVLCVGWIMLDFIGHVSAFPTTTMPVAASDLDVACGGRAANQAMALTALDCPVELIARVGEDEHGALLLGELDEMGVGFESVQMAPSATGIRLIAEAQSAGQTVIAWPGANDFLTVDDLNRRNHLFADADVVSITAEPAGAVVRRALELASQSEATSVLTYVAGSELSDAVLSTADILVLSDSTCHGLLDPGMTREQPEHAARVLSQRGAKAVVLLTSDKVLLARGAEAKMVVSPQPLNSEDAVDAFVAGLTQGLADGDKLESAIIRAVRAACLLVG